jgi:hypothetical protein
MDATVAASADANAAIYASAEEAKRLAVEAAAEYARTLQEMTDNAGDLFDFAGKALEEFVANQKQTIEDIENTGFGGYLDAFAKAYIRSQDPTIKPEVAANLDKAMREYISVIQKYAGEAGKKLNFDDLKRDIDEALKALKNEITGATLGSGASGLLGGKTGGGNCGTSSNGSITIARMAGGLR